MARPIVTLAILIVFCSGSHAEIYKWTDSAGKTHYSNNKPGTENAEALSIQENYIQGRPAYQPPSNHQRRTSSPQSHYVHAPTPGASLDECERTKVNAVYAAKAKSKTRGEKLEDWLWKNCRAYSRELRKIEQQMM